MLHTQARLSSVLTGLHATNKLVTFRVCRKSSVYLDFPRPEMGHFSKKYICNYDANLVTYLVSSKQRSHVHHSLRFHFC